jgi:hypothetical protein
MWDLDATNSQENAILWLVSYAADYMNFSLKWKPGKDRMSLSIMSAVPGDGVGQVFAPAASGPLVFLLSYVVKRAG